MCGPNSGYADSAGHSRVEGLKVRDIMTPEPRALLPDETVARAATLMRDADVGMIPIIRDLKNRELAGVITDRDIVVRHVAMHHDWDCSVEEHMTNEKLASVEPEDEVFHAIRLMKDALIRRIPVTDPDGRLVGILALADIARHLGPEAPSTVEELLERVSEPAHLPAHV
jgi:CBS domain-containing protein